MKTRSIVLAVLLTGALTPPLRAGEADAPAAQAFDYFSNSYNVIGLKDYREGTRVLPDNSLLLGDKGTARIRFGSKLTRALCRPRRKRRST